MSYNFCQLFLDYITATLPYIQFGDELDKVIACTNALFQSIDGQNIDNIKILVDGNFFDVAEALLGLYYILPGDDPEDIILKNYEENINKVSDEYTWQVNYNLITKYINYCGITSNKSEVNSNKKMMFNVYGFNRKLSVVKLNIITILLELFKNTSYVRDYVLFSIYTRIDPRVFKRVFCYQHALFK